MSTGSESMAPVGRHDAQRDDVAGSHEPRLIGLAIPNIWLLFLAFPLVTVAGFEQAAWRKATSMLLIGAFAIAHIAGYRAGAGTDRAARAARPPGAMRPVGFWFGVMVVVAAVGIGIGSWPMFGVTPFLVSYAIFNFGWPSALAVAATVLAAVIVAPAVAGLLGELWFFSLIILSVTAGAGLLRVSEEHTAERAALQTRISVGDERERVARDVHDVLGHSLTAIVLKGQVIERLLADITVPSDHDGARLDDARRHLRDLDDVSRTALGEIRATVGGLRSAELADEIDAARVVLTDAGVDLHVAGDPASVAADLRPLLGWVVREAVTNVVRHALASRCVITIGEPDGPLLIRVDDDGIGRRGRTPGNGLRGLADRVDAAGAVLEVVDRVMGSPAGTGTAVEVWRGVGRLGEEAS